MIKISNLRDIVRANKTRKLKRNPQRPLLGFCPGDPGMLHNLTQALEESRPVI